MYDTQSQVWRGLNALGSAFVSLFKLEDRGRGCVHE